MLQLSELFELGDIIRKLRKRKHIGLIRLSKIAGVNKATISRVENNRVKPETETIEKIAQALGYQASEILACLESQNLMAAAQQAAKHGFVCDNPDHWKLHEEIEIILNKKPDPVIRPSPVAGRSPRSGRM